MPDLTPPPFVPAACPAMPLPLAGGEIVDLPAVPALRHDDVAGWKDHVRALLVPTPERPEDHWQRDWDRDQAAPLLAMTAVEMAQLPSHTFDIRLPEGRPPTSIQRRPNALSLSTFLGAFVSNQASSHLGRRLSAGMQEAMVGLFLALGGPITLFDLRTAARETANPRLMERLLDVAEHRVATLAPAATSDGGWLTKVPTVLHQAVENRHPGALGILDRLVDHGAVRNGLNANGETALGVAVALHHLDPVHGLAIAQRLLDHGVPVDLHGESANTPLYQAVRLNIGPLVGLFLAAGADVWTTLTAGGSVRARMTTMAIENGLDEALEALIRHGVNPTVQDPYLDSLERTAMGLAQQMLEYPANPKGRQRCHTLMERFTLHHALDRPNDEVPTVLANQARTRL